MGFLTFLLLLIFASSAYSFCPITTCTNTTTIPVRFPFRVEQQQPKNCSYPGFGLYCTDQGLTALSLPRSGQFLVRSISYQTQSIQLHDPENCLPRRLLDGFDPSDSPFDVGSYVNYTFLSCPRNVTDNRFTVIDCLSNSTTSVMATSQSIFAHKMANKSCQMIRSLRVPRSWDEDADQGFTSSLSDDIWVSWDKPDCIDCELRGGFCGFESNDGQHIGCFYGDPSSGDSEGRGASKGLKIMKIIAFCIAAPALVCALCASIYLLNLATNWSRRRLQPPVVVPDRFLEEAPRVAIGLDQATIESYTKVVLGESRRVPGLSDGTCPICLSEFKPKETLRCIPDCRHCFHSECIDEWLGMNGTCPLCRVSPAHHLPAPATTPDDVGPTPVRSEEVPL